MRSVRVNAATVKANREKIRAYGRVYQRARGSFVRHGLRPDRLAALWEAQGDPVDGDHGAVEDQVGVPRLAGAGQPSR